MSDAPRPGPSGRATSVLGVLGSVVLWALCGLASGLAAVLVHTDWWGLLLGLVATAALLVALGGRRWPRPAFAVGWVVALVLGMLPRPEGDYLVPGTLDGYLLLATVPVWLVAGLTSLAGPGQRPRDVQDPGSLDHRT